MRHLAVIPARSGSKALKDKNIKLLDGKPLMAYTIEAAVNSKLFDEIMVSTDSDHYAEIAKKIGASVPYLRDADLATDQASSWDVVKDVLKKYEEKGVSFDFVTLLQPTSPLRSAQDIIDGFHLMNEKRANAIVAVCEVDHSPLWANTLPADRSLESFINKEVIHSNRQQLSTFYRINGALYMIKVDYLLSHEDIYEDRCYALVMSKEHSIDIDDDLDFKIAEALIKS